jgi:hypothetical protein
VPDHKKNKRKQLQGLKLLQKQMPGFYLPSKEDKHRVLEILGVSKRFIGTFDALRLNVPSFAKVKNAKHFELIEIKNSDKYLPNLPHGCFFGLTENEEMLLKVFEDKYFLCLVCLNRRSPGFKLLGWTELRALNQNKRIQYQINLHAKAKTVAVE